MGSTFSKPTLRDLHISLYTVREWKRFAVHLAGITQEDIDAADRVSGNEQEKAFSLYERWLVVDQYASWRSIVSALEEAGELDLANSLEDKLSFASLVQGVF